jgi:hypothetical protein
LCCLERCLPSHLGGHQHWIWTATVIAAGADSRVVMKNGNSLDSEIENLCSSPRAAGRFATSSRTVAKSDTDGVRINFADIAAGKVRVTE